MDSFEINKILGAVLGTCLILLAVHIAAGAIFTPERPAKPGYEIAVKQEQPEQKSGTATATGGQPIANLLATASVKQGEAEAKVCETCHNFGKGQGTKIGPDLYGVVGRPVASEPGFSYSAALKAKGGTWTFDALNKWLANPRADVPGTAMTFAGLPSEKQRANVIAYLNSNSDKPLPLPKPEEAKPPSGQVAANPPAGNNAPAPSTGNAPTNAQATGGQPIESLLATASVKKGEADAKVCEVCHNFGKGQGNKIGPDLYGVVGRPVASEPGFSYSAALKAKGGTWTFDALNTWLANPRADVPGTMMTFAGLPSEKQRADVIAYLNSNSDKPLPLPKPAEAKPQSGQAAANPPAGTNAPAPSTGNTPTNAPAAPAGGKGLPQTNSQPAGQSNAPPASPAH